MEARQLEFWRPFLVCAKSVMTYRHGICHPDVGDESSSAWPRVCTSEWDTPSREGEVLNLGKRSSIGTDRFQNDPPWVTACSFIWPRQQPPNGHRVANVVVSPPSRCVPVRMLPAEILTNMDKSRQVGSHERPAAPAGPATLRNSNGPSGGRPGIRRGHISSQ